jgi:hypothetical protein
MKPYIGVTGVFTAGEIDFLLQAVPATATRPLMAGVLVSSKTLSGLTNKYPRQFPPMENIASIFRGQPRTLRLIHYSTDEPQTLATQLLRLTRIGGPYLDGFQLNVAWPPVVEVEKFWERYGGCRMVLQIGSGAMAAVGRDPQALANRVAGYEPFITDVLIDPSGGKGIPFDPDAALDYLVELHERCPNLGLGLAGGLGPETVSMVDPVVARIPFLSIDAQGRLRNSDDDLDLAATRAYLKNAYLLFSAAPAEEPA